MSSRASRPRRRMATVAGATALSLGSFSIAGLGGFRPASVYGSQLSPRSFALTCTHYAEDDTELQTAVTSSVDLDVICIENSITLSRTLELDDTSVTFLGDDTNTTLTAPTGSRHIKADFSDAQADTLLIQELTLTGGRTAVPGGSGGAVNVMDDSSVADADTIFLKDAYFTDNVSSVYGGALYSTVPTYVYGGAFTGSTARDGGAIRMEAPLTIDGATFLQNVTVAATSDGGAIFMDDVVTDHVLTVRNSYFRDNFADDRGGAIYSDDTIVIASSTFVANVSDYGGAVNAGYVSVANSTFLSNIVTYASGAGGSIFATDARIGFSTFVNNSAPNGGAVFVGGGTLSAQGTVFSVPANTNACNTTADDSSFDSFSTDSSCGLGDDTVNLVTRAQLGLDDTLVTDDSTGARVLIPDDTSILVNAAPANLVAGVTRDQLLALRGRAPDDSTTAGAVQVLPILITAQPQDATVAVGANASFTAGAVPGVGTSVAYQWQSSSDSGQNWADLAGQTSSSLVLASVPSGDDGLQVRVAVTDLRNQPVNSNPATLTVSANPTPVPSFPPGPPRDVVAVPGDGAVSVSWEPPASVGSFPVSSYQVEDESGRHTCLVSVASGETLECVIDGLVNGQEYAFRVRALNGAGWGAWSTWSDPVRPVPGRSILITGSRDGRFVRVEGETTGLVGEQLIPRVRFPGPKPYTTGTSRPQVNEAGEFTWQRRTNKKTYVYFFVEDVRSNRVIIQAREATER